MWRRHSCTLTTELTTYTDHLTDLSHASAHAGSPSVSAHSPMPVSRSPDRQSTSLYRHSGLAPLRLYGNTPLSTHFHSMPARPSSKMVSALTLLCLLVTLFTVTAHTAPYSPLDNFGAPLAPNPPTNYIHPLLSTIHHTTTTRDIQPGQLNQFVLKRPEGERTFYLYVPTWYGKNTTGLPVALFFHGYSGSWQQGVSLNMTDAAERMGYLIAFPQGTPAITGYLGWNAGSCCLFNVSSIVDDVEFARQAIRAIESAVLVDASRRYAMGWSNGAMMSERLACEASDLFAGVAADEGAVVLSTTGVEDSLLLCDVAFDGKRINYLHFHGTADPTVSWTGNASYPYFPSTLQDVTRWVTREGCSGTVSQTYNDGTFSNMRWSDCREGREVELMTVRNGVHWWWTMNYGGFSTVDYALQWFDRTHGKQVAADAERATKSERKMRMADA